MSIQLSPVLSRFPPNRTPLPVLARAVLSVA